MPLVHELLTKRPGAMQDQEKVSQFNEQLRSESATILATLNIEVAPASLEESAIRNNAITLTSGNHGGVTLAVDDTAIKGMPAGVFMTKKVSFDADAVVDGIHFTSSPDNSDELAVIGGSATVVFRACTLEKFPTTGSTFVTVESGGKALFVGCVFRGSPPSGDVISNAVAANVQLVGCYNKTGNPLGTVTSTGGL